MKDKIYIDMQRYAQSYKVWCLKLQNMHNDMIFHLPADDIKHFPHPFLVINEFFTFSVLIIVFQMLHCLYLHSFFTLIMLNLKCYFF